MIDVNRSDNFDAILSLLQVPNADIVSRTNNRIYVIKNKSYNYEITDDFLSIEFIGGTNGNSGSIATVELEITEPNRERDADYYQCGCGYEVTCIKSWPGHLKARVTIPLATPLTSGWTLFLQFSDPVSNIQVRSHLACDSILNNK